MCRRSSTRSTSALPAASGREYAILRIDDAGESMKINRCQIENFTVFDKQDIEFCDGVNVFIGANGTGKSHLLKLLYAMTRWCAGEITSQNQEQAQLRFAGIVNGIFKPEDGDIGKLIRLSDTGAISDIKIELDSGFDSSVRLYADRKHQNYDPYEIPQVNNSAGLFIPPNEVLAIYPGFVASYEKRELAFDQTYYDICKALAAAPLKQKHGILSRLIVELENIIEGKVVQKGDHFYVQREGSEKPLEAHLLAEGHRKIAAVVHLINNGSINKDTALFWDEPEANLNPNLIKHVALFLQELARVGIQVFVATHDYLLTGELSLAAEYQTEPAVPIRFFAMSRQGEKPVTIQSGETLADLENNPILDEFAAHYERERQAALSLMKNGGGE